ncbi:choline/glycine/proline betaine transport protein [Palleronia salina]|uniref:Choline/glycine/proline betaine transport protein n=1 Tax=Palleronia salina TaxID=313368 RepID=A0A1M6HJ47_9RHOB|nr:BCCT family transporter [Palleronia salina]SHJ22179.1 choline/glycine/proline betaine transport protein [Palleronia salina]
MDSRIKQDSLWIFPRVNRSVFVASAVLILGFIVFGALFNDLAKSIFTGAQTVLASNLGWLLIIEVNLLLIFVIFLALGPFGDIRLGKMDEAPEYGLLSWTAMLFSAGIGIGLIYWGVAEPMFHYFSPPMGEAETVESAKQAMTLSFMHWGFHAWAIYAVIALALAYFHYRQGLPLTIRSSLYPLLGERIYGRWGDLVDVLAVFGTMFGIVTSLGLGAIQINSGLERVFGLPESAFVQVIIIAFITAAATASVLAGLDGGIKRLSNLNIFLSFLMLAFMVVVGPTLFIFDSFVENYGNSVNSLIDLGTWAEGWGDGTWQNSWTIFYWAWWVSWAPFVGVFIARISRGRTIREFLLGIMLIPCSIMFFWFTAFGGTAIRMSLAGETRLVEATQENYAQTMFELLTFFPFSGFMSVFAVVLIVLWFVTSSDSGSFVIDMLTAGGDPDPPKIQRVFWAVSEGAVASVLLVMGGLDALQAAAVIAGFPFAAVIAIVAVGLWRALRWDSLMVHRHKQRYRNDREADHNMPDQPHSAELDDIGKAEPSMKGERAPAE